jgi:hypothetical protein
MYKKEGHTAGREKLHPYISAQFYLQKETQYRAMESAQIEFLRLFKKGNHFLMDSAEESKYLRSFGKCLRGDRLQVSLTNFGSTGW